MEPKLPITLQIIGRFANVSLMVFFAPSTVFHGVNRPWDLSCPYATPDAKGEGYCAVEVQNSDGAILKGLTDIFGPRWLAVSSGADIAVNFKLQRLKAYLRSHGVHCVSVATNPRVTKTRKR